MNASEKSKRTIEIPGAVLYTGWVADEKGRYEFRDAKCIDAECWVPGVFQHRGATLSGSRNTGAESLCCTRRAYHGCPNVVIRSGDLARQRRAEGWRRA